MENKTEPFKCIPLRCIYTFFFAIFAHLAFSQSSVGLSIGGTFGQLKFENSEGVVDENLIGVPGAAASAYYFFDLGGVVTSASSGQNLLGVELGYKSSKFKDKASSQLTTWELQYITSRLLFRRITNSTNKARLFFGGGLAMDYLYGGTQNQGFSQFEITDALNALNVSLSAETGLTYIISSDTYATLRLGYLRGISNLEKDSSQQAFVHGFKLSMAIFFHLNGS